MIPQTVSLDIAKQLKESGWSKSCMFTTYEDQKGWIYAACMIEYRDFKDPKFLQLPMLHDILEELPAKIKIGGETAWLEIYKYSEGYEVYYSCSDSGCIGYSTNNSPHNACALLWIWCVKEGYITFN